MSYHQTYFYPAATFPQESSGRGWNIGGEVVNSGNTVYATSVFQQEPNHQFVDLQAVQPTVDEMPSGIVATMSPAAAPPEIPSAHVVPSSNYHGGTLPKGWSVESDSTFAQAGDITGDSYSSYNSWGSGHSNSWESGHSNTSDGALMNNSEELQTTLLPAVSTSTPAVSIGAVNPPRQTVQVVDTLSSVVDATTVIAADNIPKNF